MTGEEITAEQHVFDHFHSLRKHNSSRRARQEAWAATERILERRRRQAMRTHPIAPEHRWWDFNDTAPKGWTFPAFRTLETDEVEELCPGALAAFATQCDDIPRSRFVYAQYDKKLRLSVPMSHGDTKHSCVTWLPDMKIWRRYCTSVRSRPWRTL